MKKKAKKQFLSFIPVLILLLIFGVSIPSIINIGNKMESTASNNMVNATYIIENNVSAKVQGDMDALTNFAASGVEMTPKNLKLFCKSIGFFQVNLIGYGGAGYNCDGEETDLEGIGIDIENLKRTEKGISRCYYGKTGRKAIAFAAPVEAEGQVTGTLYAEREVEDYYSESVFSFYEGAGRGYLVDTRDGEFELKTLKSDGLSVTVDNLFANLEESGNEADVVKNIKNAMEKGTTGTAEVSYSGKESYICFTPVGANENWYLVTIIGKTSLMAESTAVKRTIILMLVIVVTGIVTALSIIYAIIMKGRREQEQRKNVELLESITSTVAHAFVVYNPDKQRVEYASENMEKLFGISSEQVRQDIDNLFEFLGVPRDDTYRSRLTSGKIEKYYTREHQITTADKVRWIKCEVSPSADGRYVSVLTDTTREKEYTQTLDMALQNARNANRAKSEFLSNMSHDIRTPMNGIIGMTAIAATNVDNPARVKDCLKKISDASAHLLNLINEVLDMSKIESRKVSLNEDSFNLADLMYNLIQMNHAAIENKCQELSVNVMDMKHENVIADQVKLQQVMTNIVSNAVKYTPEGGRIKISLTEKPVNLKGYGSFEFVCSDNGMGMDEAFVQKIFDPFERDRREEMRNIQGTGLGMAIVKNIVEMMGGVIKVNSTSGEGTVITVILKLRLQNSEEEEQLPRLPVLVVDDEEMCCTNTVHLLEELGMDGEWVLTGEEAIEKCVRAHEADHDYFAVIVDWRMPGMDGVEAARQIRARVGAEVPIIILTAYNYEQIETQAREAGVTAFLPKPLFKSKLYRKLKQLLKHEEDENTNLREAISSYEFKGKRILLAEDNELNMEIAVNILTFTQVEIDTASNGKEALEKYRAKPPGYYDLILMDIQMPFMNGYEATSAIRHMDREDAKSLPIIAMTANAFTEDKEKAKEAGMNGHIAKPINIQELILTLNSNLGREEKECPGTKE